MSGTLKGRKSVLVRPFIVDLLCVKTYVTLIFIFWVSVRQEILSILYLKEANLDRELSLPLSRPDEQIIDNGPRVCRNVQMGLTVGLGIQCKEDGMKFGQLC